MNDQLLRRVFFASALLLASSCYAQKAQDMVQQSIEAAMRGQCSDVLSIMVKTACENQMPGMQQKISQLGKLKKVSYKGIENTPQGPVEVYLADHEAGKMIWMAVVAPDGKLSTLWAPN
jgi:hypothetical protein